MAKIAIINESWPTYNLCTAKMQNLFRSQGHEVFMSTRADLFTLQADKVYLSVMFTWDLPNLCQDVRSLIPLVPVEIGGPAATAMPEYIIEHTGLAPHLGLDERFEHIPGDNYQMIFTSRGCPRACEFCIVQKVEGRKMIEYDDFPVPVGENPAISDNNLLATTWQHQELVVKKLTQVKNLDLNSGFDCRIFCKDPEKYFNLYSQLHLERWRFAYDKEEEREPLKVCVDYLHSKGVPYSVISVFCLAGGEGDTFDKARERAQFLIDIGVSPYVMRYRPLDSISKDYAPPGWAERDMEVLFGYFNVPWKWRTVPFEEFRRVFKPELATGMERLIG